MTTMNQRSFAGGEIAPSLYARVDQSKYQSGARTMRNFEVMRHGGVQNRSGSEYIVETKASGAVRLIPFVFNASQTYVLEFGNGYIRFIQNGEQVVVSGVAAYNGGTAYVPGNLVSSGGTNYYCIANTTGNAPPNATYWYALTGSIFEIPSPYVTADLPTLQYVQSADVVTIVHPNYAPRELARTGATAWTLTAISFAPTQVTPTNLNITSSGGVGYTFEYKVTAVSNDGEESLPSTSASTTRGSYPSSTDGNGMTWTAASGAVYYNIYKAYPSSVGGTYFYLGSSNSTSYADIGQDVDFSQTPPVANTPFGSTGNYPAAVSYYQQRRLFAGTNNDPETVWATRTGLYNNLTGTTPLQDDNYVKFSLVGRFVNRVKALLDLGRLIVFTEGGEWLINGDSSGALTPTDINARQNSYNGSGSLQPIVIGNSALFVQGRGTVVRDLGTNWETQGYKGNDLTLFAAHLFDGYTISDWCYQQITHSIVWVVRDDGTLLGLTYLPEHQVWGWHRHDTDGTYENVCAVPEGSEDALYCVVNRDGGRYIERFASRNISESATDGWKFVDSYLTHDGRNTTATTLTLSGSGWTYTDTLTLTASASTFSAGDVGGAEYWVTGADGEVIRLTVTAYTSGTVVSVLPNRTVPASLRATATATWTKAIMAVTGLDHLEGKAVSVFADGFVVANPNNSSYTGVTVTSGTATLDSFHGVITVGLPYLCDLETLDIDTTQGETLADKRKNIGEVWVYTEKSRGLWAGSEAASDDAPTSGLYELKSRSAEGYEESVALSTGVEQIILQPQWNSNGRVFLRQIDPLPLAILAVAPKGMIPLR